MPHWLSVHSLIVSTKMDPSPNLPTDTKWRNNSNNLTLKHVFLKLPLHSLLAGSMFCSAFIFGTSIVSVDPLAKAGISAPLFASAFDTAAPANETCFSLNLTLVSCDAEWLSFALSTKKCVRS